MLVIHKIKDKSLLIIFIQLKLQSWFRETSYTMYGSRKN